MQALVLLSACTALPLALGRSLRAVSVIDSGALKAQTPDTELQSLLQRISDCRADPANCGSSVDDMGGYSDNLKNQTLEAINESQEEFDNIALTFDNCGDLASGVKGFRSAFEDNVGKHRTCRQKQSLAARLASSCTALQQASAANQTQQCSSSILKTPIADLQDMCKPAHQQDLGVWLNGMATEFSKKHAVWLTQHTACIQAGWSHGNKSAECVVLGRNSTQQTESCDEELKGLESSSCAWATASKTRCSSYQKCYNGALHRFNKAVAEEKNKIKKWKQTWRAAAKMKCMASAVSKTGATVDAAKMKKCDSPKLTDTSHIKLTRPTVPARHSCPEPAIYPGSSLYRQKVYSGLPTDVNVRLPALCVAWKGGCAGHSSFAGASVYLKLNGRTCSASGGTAGRVACSGGRSLFKFEHTGNKCSGTGKLVSLANGRACRFSADGSYPQINCGSALGNPPAVVNIRSNPVASARTGQVVLDFKPIGTSLWGLQSWSSWTSYDGHFTFNCQGGINSIYSVHHNHYEDRVFKTRCLKPSGREWNMWNQYGRGWSPANGWDASFTFQCPNNHVLAGINSWHHNHFEDRKYQFYCRTLQAGVTERRSGWSGWSAWDSSSRRDCPGNGALVGITSYHSNSREDRRFRYQCTTLSVNTPSRMALQVEYAKEL